MTRDKTPSSTAAPRTSGDTDKTVFAGSQESPSVNPQPKALQPKKPQSKKPTPPTDATVFAPSSKAAINDIKEKEKEKEKPLTPRAEKTLFAKPTSHKKSAAQQSIPTRSAISKTESAGTVPPAVTPQHAIDKQARALTEIRQSMVKQDNSQGFAKAKKAADSALANNKIVLNKRFVLEKTLGAGGMGTVYKAKDLRKIEASDRNPYVAVKVLNDDFKDHPDAFVTLQREASRSHRLSHPKIVTVHDFDRDDDVIYMTMELLEGQPLDICLREIRDKGMPQEEAKPIIADICDALAFAHEKEIVHSDLKPGNVFITAEGSKILDFGIARLTCNSDNFDSGSLGALTPAYASLEMLHGDAPHPSDDLYAIAIITYELLCGRHPYNRLPADEALAQKLKPKKLDGLTKRQWEALESALQLQRDKRTPSVKDFKNKFIEKTKFPIFKVTSAVLLVILSITAYMFLFTVSDVETHAQQAIAAALSCEKNNDFKCAIEKYSTALELQPNNIEAQKNLITAKQRHATQQLQIIADEANHCLHDKLDIFCATAKLEQIKKIDPNAKEFTQITTAIAEYRKNTEIKKSITAAEICFDQANFNCALENIAHALTLDNSNAIALELKHNTELKIEQQQAQKAEQDNQYLDAMQNGTQCFDRKQFNCAIKYFELANKAKPGDTNTEALLQNAKFSKQRQQDAQEKADKILAKAKTCLDKKNFTCAISNAESALEFVPDFEKAIALLKNATAQQQAAKRNFNIQ